MSPEEHKRRIAFIEEHFGTPYAAIDSALLVQFSLSDEYLSQEFSVEPEGFTEEEIDSFFDYPEHKESVKFKLQTCKEFAVLQSQKWFVKGILPKAELAVVYGAPGSGKSFAVLDMVMAIARNAGQWCEHTVKSANVVYVCAEAPSGFRNRILAYTNRHDITDGVPNFTIIPESPNLLLKQDIDTLAASIGKTDIIVVDTLARTFSGGDENSGRDMSLYINNCQILNKQTGALVILIHHSGKDVDRGSRGWSGLLGAVDTEIRIEKMGTSRQIEVTKQKEGESGEKINFFLSPIVLGVDEDGEDITSCVFEHSQAELKKTEKPKPLGGVQKTILECFESFDMDIVDVEDLAALVIPKLTHDKTKEDQRRRRFFNSIERMSQDKILSFRDDLVYRL